MSFCKIETYVVDLMKCAVRVNDIDHSFRVPERQSRAVLRREWGLDTEVRVRHIAVNPNEPNNEDKNQDNELHSAKNIIQNDAPFSWNCVEQACEGISSQRYCNDSSRSFLCVCGIEEVLGHGYRVGRSVFEDHKSYSKQTCGKESWFLQEIVELMEINISLNPSMTLPWNGHKHSSGCHHSAG